MSCAAFDLSKKRSVFDHPVAGSARLGIARHGLEGLRPEARVALDGGAASCRRSIACSASRVAVDRDDDHVLARHLAGGLDRRDRADRHLVVVRIDRGRVGVGLQQRLGDLAALVAGEVAGLGGHDLHAGNCLDRLVEALLRSIGRRGAGGALELDDLGVAVRRPWSAPRRRACLLHEVRADEGDVVLARPWRGSGRRCGRAG